MTRFLVVGALVASSFGAPAQAQINNSNATPAEFPPASYTAAQYVDSRGCVFIRAGIDGNVTWVPRVNRSRRPICGQTPSLPSRTAAAPAAPRPAQAPVQITNETPPAAETPAAAPRPAPTATAPAPKPAPRRTAAAAPAPRQVAPAPRRVAPAPKPVVAAAPKPAAPKPAPKVVAAAPAPTATARSGPACLGLSSVSSRYVNSGRDHPVRCGPQAQSSTSGASAGLARQSNAQVGSTRPVVPQDQVASLPPSTRIVPRQVFENRQNTGFQPVPEGYRRAWEDDRLNTRRAEQTVRGYQRTQLIWTNTTPRRLINQATGQDVTRSMPLVYPYTDVATQERELGTVTLVRKDGQVMKRVKRNTRVASTPAPTVSTRSAPKPAPAVKPSSASTLQGRGLVQAALYRDDAGARAAAQRVAQLGLPVTLGTMQHRGEALKVVMVGPFQTGDAQVGALRRVRAAGFANARLR